MRNRSWFMNSTVFGVAVCSRGTLGMAGAAVQAKPATASVTIAAEGE